MGLCSSKLEKVQNLAPLPSVPCMQSEGSMESYSQSIASKSANSPPLSERIEARAESYSPPSQTRKYFSFSAFVAHNPEPQLFQWKFLSLIGNGSYSQIYKVVNVESNEVCSAKVYNNSIICRSHGSSNVTIKKALLDAVSLTQQVSTPYLMPVCEQIDDKQTNSFIVISTFSEHGNLEKSVSMSPLSMQSIITCFYQMASALHEFHSHGIIHGSVCPENILRFGDNFFNLKLLSTIQNAEELLSPPDHFTLFSSPEQCSKQPYDGKASDIWSLGITIYYLINMTFPFQYSTIDSELSLRDELVQHIRTFKIHFTTNPGRRNEALNALVTEMLRANPLERISLKKLLLDPIFDDARILVTSSHCSL